MFKLWICLLKNLSSRSSMYHKSSLSISIILIIALLFELCKCHNKYSNEINQSNDSLTNQFRMSKINLIWEQAQKKLNFDQSQTLLRDLKEQDQLEIELKKLKSKNEDHQKEIEVRSKLNLILVKYGLKNTLKDTSEDIEDDIQDNADDMNDNIKLNYNEQFFKDKNLNKLWIKAMESKFTDEQLKILKEQFHHYEKQLIDYYKLIDQLNELKEKERIENEKWINSIEREDHLIDKSNDRSNDFESHLNDKHKEIKNKFIQLKDKVLGHVELDKSNFDYDETEKMWKIAKQSNLDQIELEFIKGELIHFEHRIKKLNHLHGHMIKNEFDIDLEQMDSEENEFLKNKMKELTYQIDKLRESIQNKLKIKIHSEL